MAEIQLTKIKSIYGDIKGLLSQIPLPNQDSYISSFIVKQFNSSIDELSDVTGTDYSRNKVTHEAIVPTHNHTVEPFYYSASVRPQIGRTIGRLEEEYGFGSINNQSSPNIAIFNKNQNELSINIDYTINNLIDKADDEEQKTKLRELRDELNKPNKNWEIIKSILIWILNFSKDLFLEVLPIILQSKI
ncbi:MAG: hypothetical protein AAB446_02940 [Patescibacteria group bacterium]